MLKHIPEYELKKYNFRGMHDDWTARVEAQELSIDQVPKHV